MGPYVGMKFNNFLSLATGKSFVAVVLGNVYLVTPGVTSNYLLVNQPSSQKLLQRGKGKQWSKQRSIIHLSLKIYHYTVYLNYGFLY